ncbi:MAG: site-specific integrase [Chloroflexi bacterium]|nr:site-specific integrase [Chloroflexota bacterium]
MFFSSLVTHIRRRHDVAIIALLLATDLRESDVQPEIDDLHQTYGGVPALRVKAGKGAKARMVPFGEMLWARQITELWLNGRESGQVFTQMRQGCGDIRYQEATNIPTITRSIQRLLSRYPISIDGEQRAVTPHDFRQSYARNLFQTGIAIEVIRQNRGHVDAKTTQSYIGVLGGSARAPVSVYEPTEILARMQDAVL